MLLFGPTEKAEFISRPNRFVVVCRCKGEEIRAYLPNPGRLTELLLPGVTLYIEKSQNPARKLPYTAVAVERGESPIILHTHRANDIAEYLIIKRLVPGLEKYEILKREVTVGGSRFDFLLGEKGRGRRKKLLEVKSCTLFSSYAAMFPDAVTVRGRRHVDELSALSGDKTTGHVLFIVNNPEVDFFIPDYHTDLEFARTLLAARNKIPITPLAIRVNKNLELNDRVRVIKIPWEIVEREARDSGAYLVVLRMDKEMTIPVGASGEQKFKKGFYVYAGSAKKNLSKRIQRHRKRGKKKKFWHIDYLRECSQFLYVLPVRTADDIECPLSKGLKEISNFTVPGFGSSDCACPSHLFGFDVDPLNLKEFHDLLNWFRVDRFF
ncbi:MAG: DNA/RNA nuclease SfsA [Thermodesulfobacteriota bacterium]